MESRKKSSTLVIILLIAAVCSQTFVMGPMVIFSRANPGDIDQSWYNETTLNVTILQLQPRINWYDLRNATGVSFLNSQLDVDQEYTFYVNISSDQGWDDIEYIYIQAWHDNGSEATTYNHTGNHGGNRNLYLVYDNTSNASAVYSMYWPTGGEASLGSMSETIVTDHDGSPEHTVCKNISFSFTPSYQFRYAPDPTNAAAGHNDLWSWNFNISVLDFEGYWSYHNPTVGETVDEFGVYAYAEIVSAGWPTITGNPGTTAKATQNITMETRSNGNYSLSSDVDTLQHKTNPGATMPNTTVYIRGGDLDTVQNLSGYMPLFLYGNWSASTYNDALVNGTKLDTTDIEYRCAIPLAQIPGDYNATIRYRLKVET